MRAGSPTAAAAIVTAISLTLCGCGDDADDPTPGADDPPTTSVDLDRAPSTVPESTVPESTVPESTVPESTAPGPTAPGPTVTLPTPLDPDDPNYPTLPPPTSVTYPSVDPRSG